MLKFTKINIFFIFTFFMILGSLNAQKNNGLVLVQGKVTDNETGKPLGITIVFTNMGGKKIQVKSNSTDGTYQQVLQSGEAYAIQFKDYVLVEDVNLLELQKSEKYMELTRNFKVRKIAVGMNLCNCNAFSSNRSDIALKNINCFNEAKDFLTDNPKVNLLVTVHTHDSHFKASKKKVPFTDKKGKIKNKTVTVTPGELLDELADSRIRALKDFFKTLNISERRIIFEKDTKSALTSEKTLKTKSGKKEKVKKIESDNLPNVYIRIGKIADL
jgi:hypothetical protein